MTSQGGSGDQAGVFNTTNPFSRDEGEHAGTENGRESLGLPDQGSSTQDPDVPLQQYATAQDAGVRSSNPFENGGHSHQDSVPVETPGTDISPTTEGPGKIGQIDSRTPAGLVDSEPPSAVSPGGGGVLQNTDPFDYADRAGGPTDTDANLEATDSNGNDRAERGTALFVDANAYHPKDESSSGSSSNEKEKDEKPRQGITFAGGDEKIDSAPTHPDEEDVGIVEKLKSNVKEKFHLQSIKSRGPFKMFNPTSVRMNVSYGEDENQQRDPANDIGILWRSRDNRKGRNSIVMPRASMAYPNLPQKGRPIYTSSFKGVRQNLWRMCFTFPYWDMAFWSGWAYTWGSVLFVIDGTWAWLPYSFPDRVGEGIGTYGVGILFFVGALLYQLGAVMAYLEAVNDGSFHGSAMRRFLEGHQDETKEMLDAKLHNFFSHMNPLHKSKDDREDEEAVVKAKDVDPEHGWKTIHRPAERRGSIYPAGKRPAPRRGGIDLGEAEEGESHEYLTWRWFPTWEALKNHHVYEIGYIACSIQLFGATLYSWCGLVSLHGITEHLDTNAKEYGAYWFPEICGSVCFVTASGFFLLETQEHWWKPMPLVVGWWIGVWAMIGSWGFLLNGIFGAVATATGAHWADYQSELSSTWGSFGYLCSALCQWYEAVNKHPVEEMFNEPGEMKSFQVHLP